MCIDIDPMNIDLLNLLKTAFSGIRMCSTTVLREFDGTKYLACITLLIQPLEYT